MSALFVQSCADTSAVCPELGPLWLLVFLCALWEKNHVLLMFTTLLACRTIWDDDSAVLFKLFDIWNIPEVPQELIVIQKKQQILKDQQSRSPTK